MEAPSLNPFEKSAIEMRKIKCDSLCKKIFTSKLLLLVVSVECNGFARAVAAATFSN